MGCGFLRAMTDRLSWLPPFGRCCLATSWDTCSIVRVATLGITMRGGAEQQDAGVCSTDLRSHPMC